MTLLIWGSSKEEHDERIRRVLNKAKAAKLVLTPEKCEFRVEKVTFLGEILSEEGIQADPQKLAAIMEMPTPSCKANIQRLLGMVNYLGKFIPNLSVKTTALKRLLEERIT